MYEYICVCVCVYVCVYAHMCAYHVLSPTFHLCVFPSPLLIFPSSLFCLSGGEASVLLSESKTVTGTQVNKLHSKSRFLCFFRVVYY